MSATYNFEQHRQMACLKKILINKVTVKKIVVRHNVVLLYQNLWSFLCQQVKCLCDFEKYVKLKSTICMSLSSVSQSTICMSLSIQYACHMLVPSKTSLLNRKQGWNINVYQNNYIYSTFSMVLSTEKILSINNQAYLLNNALNIPFSYFLLYFIFYGIHYPRFQINTFLKNLALHLTARTCANDKDDNLSCCCLWESSLYTWRKIGLSKVKMSRNIPHDTNYQHLNTSQHQTTLNTLV